MIGASNPPWQERGYRMFAASDHSGVPATLPAGCKQFVHPATSSWISPEPRPCLGYAALISDRPLLAAPVSPPTVLRWLTALGVAVAIGVLALGMFVLAKDRATAWRSARQSSGNLILALDRDIERNVAVYGLSLQGVVDALAEPGLSDVSPALRRDALFDRAASAEYLGSILVLDRSGSIVDNSTTFEAGHLDLSDRDYFVAQKADPGGGLFLSRPFRSRLRGGDPSIAISRALLDGHGRFAGIVSGTMRLAFFQHLFESLDLGRDGSVVLVRTDGQIVARLPHGASDIDRNLTGSRLLAAAATSSSGSYVAASSFDGIRRLFVFRRVGNLPLVLAVGVSTDNLLAAWRQEAAYLGLALLALCLATIALCLLFRREMMRRLASESALSEAASKLAYLAATDALTGVANRGAFDEALLREWRRAARADQPLALIMLDVDHFKAFNDRYGHQAGDVALRSVAGCIEVHIRRPGDLSARYGGEEFVILLPDTEMSGAYVIADRVRRTLADMDIPHAGSSLGHVTASFGIAAIWPQPAADPAMLVSAADQALYEAKRFGRNRISSRADAAHSSVMNSS